MDLRLDTLAKMVPKGSRVADIGTDHAYLPISLVKNDRVKYALASDIAKGPLTNAAKDIKRAGLSSKISLRLGPGLTTVKRKDNIDTVVIAGMGGKLISRILNDAFLNKELFAVLVLEPNNAEPLLRSWLMIHGYQIKQEKLLEEASHYYELIKAVYIGKVKPLTPAELLFGPLILKHKNPIFAEKWGQQLTYLKKLLLDLNKAKHKNRQRINKVEDEIKLIEEELDD